MQTTENTYALIAKLKRKNPADTLIVTSIQKMSNIKDEEGGLNVADIDKINTKRIVFVVDEAHRSTFGDMLITVKRTFPDAVFLGFTGTPIHEEHQKRRTQPPQSLVMSCIDIVSLMVFVIRMYWALILNG